MGGSFAKPEDASISVPDVVEENCTLLLQAVLLYKSLFRDSVLL
jgi:hypothetical protein